MFSVVVTTHDNYDWPVFTTMSLLATAGHLVSDIVCVDLNPTGPASAALAQFFITKNPKLRYQAFGATNSLSAGRDAAIRAAKSEYVVCLNGGTVLMPAALPALKKFYDDNPDKREDLVHGPRVNETFAVVGTHLDDAWGSQAWGKPAVSTNIRSDLYFEVRAQSLGMFSVRREDWLGFNPAFRGYGNDEWYIHEKYRKAGRTCWCLTPLKWWHSQTQHPGPYPCTAADRCRSYVIGLTELGIPLDPCKEHFVASGLIKPAEWNIFVREAELKYKKPEVPAPKASKSPLTVADKEIDPTDFPALQKAAAAARAYRTANPCGQLGKVLENTPGCGGKNKHVCNRGLFGGKACPARECVSCEKYEDIGTGTV